MLEFRSFHPSDPARISAQRQQADEKLFGSTIASSEVLAGGLAISAWENGVCIGCAGILELWQDRASAWCLMSEACGKHLLEITRVIREALDLHPARRIEMTVLADFPAGIRWARMLGFRVETPEPMRRYMQERDAYLYARVR